MGCNSQHEQREEYKNEPGAFFPGNFFVSKDLMDIRSKRLGLFLNVYSSFRKEVDNCFPCTDLSVCNEVHGVAG